jgi:hypothetical protein
MTRKRGAARFEELRALWESAQAAERQAYKPRPDPPKRGRIQDTIAWVRWLSEVTSEPAFVEALAAFERYGLMRRGGATVRRLRTRVYGAQEQAMCLARMETLVKRGMSQRSAAAEVAFRFDIKGASFEAVTTELRTQYRRAGLNPGNRRQQKQKGA